MRPSATDHWAISSARSARMLAAVLAIAILVSVQLVGRPAVSLPAHAAASVSAPRITWVWTSCECGSEIPWRQWRLVVDFDRYEQGARYSLQIARKGTFRVHAGPTVDDRAQAFITMGRAGLEEGKRYRLRLIASKRGDVGRSAWVSKRVTTDSQPFPP